MGIIIRNNGQGGRITFRSLGLGGHITSGWPVTSTGLLLDTYSGAAAAYSLRKLNTSYSGSAIRVRRSSDNTEQNIGFTNNALDTASLLTFCGVGNGFVTTWYDQSGNSRNLIQATSANQPNIVTGGTIQNINGKPVVYFNNTTHALSIAYGFSGNNSFIFDLFKTSDSSFLLYNGPDQSNYYMTAGTFSETISPLNGNSTLYQTYRNSVLQTLVTRDDVYKSLSVNDQILVTQKISLLSWPNFSIGGYTSFYFEHYKSELVIYNTDQTANRGAIESNIDSYYSTYSPGSNLLDQYPYAAAAYSVRKLRTRYTGSAIRVRRSSDNAESDIGFVNNELDTATLTTFIGANSGFVTTWYDQGFYGRNLIETTAANQPIIVNAGTIQTVNGKPAVYFDTTAKKLSVAYGFPGATSFIFDVLKSNDTTFLVYHGQSGGFFFASVGNSADSSTLINYNANVSQYYRNGALQTSPTTRIGVYNLVSTNTQILLTHKLTLSGWPAFTISGYASFEFVHYKQELVIYNRDVSTDNAAINSNINTYYSIY